MKSPTRFLFIHSFLLSWLILCVIFFMITNRVSFLYGYGFPDGLSYLKESLVRIEPFYYILNLIGSLAGVILFSLAAFSLGMEILHFKEVSLAGGVTAFVVGEIILSIVFLTVLSLYRLTPIISGSVLLISIVIGYPIIKRWMHILRDSKRSIDFNGCEKTILILLFIVLVGTLLLSSARLGYDAAAEYFSNAKIMAMTGKSEYLYPKDPFLVSSLHPIILFTTIIQLFGDQSARLLSWINGAGIILIGIAIGKKLNLSPSARLWFVILMVTSTFFLDLFGDGKIELISTLPLLTAIYWMVESIESPSRNIFLLIGTLAGFAIISRPYNIFLVPIFMVCFYAFPVFTFYYSKVSSNTGKLFHRTFRINHSPPRIQPYLYFLFLPMLTLGVFHLWQNSLWMGNPIAPLTYYKDVNTSTWQWQFDPSFLSKLRLLYPLSVTFFNSEQSLGNISPLFIGFLPFLLVASVRRNVHLAPLMRQLLVCTLFTIILWLLLFFTVVEIRYVMFLWILLFLFLAEIIDSALKNIHRAVSPFLRAVTLLLLIFIFVRVILIALSTYSPIDQNGQAYCYDTHYCTFLESINQLAEPGDRVLSLHAFHYYMRPDLFACSSRATEYIELMELVNKDPEAFWEALYQHGFKYITYESSFAVFQSRLGVLPNPDLAPDWLMVKNIKSNESNAIYQIAAINPPYPPKLVCTSSEPGKWDIHSIK
jgi:hypothetical protein